MLVESGTLTTMVHLDNKKSNDNFLLKWREQRNQVLKES